MSEPEARDSGAGAKRRSDWFTPAGISALAGVAGLVLVVVGWFIADGLRAGAEAPASTPAQGEADTAIFVYGSAMPGQWGYSVIERYVESSRRDEVDGLLFDSGRGYPMAMFEVGDSIPGFLIQLDAATAEDALRALTQFEGGLFHPVEVRTASGATALAYEWIGTTEGYPRIDAWDPQLAGDFGSNFALAEFFDDECFDSSPRPGHGVLVNCAAPHEFRVYHVHTVSGDAAAAFPGQQSLVGIAEERCAEAFAAEFAREHLAEEISWGLPSEAAWQEGVRTVVCAARAVA